MGGLPSAGVWLGGQISGRVADEAFCQSEGERGDAVDDDEGVADDGGLDGGGAAGDDAGAGVMEGVARVGDEADVDLFEGVDAIAAAIRRCR